MLLTMLSDEDILFAYSIVLWGLSATESNALLKDIIQLWMTIRGFSIASKFMEDYKLSTNRTTKAKKSLRHQLKEHQEHKDLQASS